LSDLAKYSMTQSIARPLCDSRANFHLNWLTFLEAMTMFYMVRFLSGHSVDHFWVLTHCLLLYLSLL